MKVALMICCAVLAIASQAAAQQPGRIMVSGGLEWMGGVSYGSATANEITPSGGSFPLFATSNDLSASAGAGAKVTVRLTHLFEVEASATYTRPAIESTISNDTEGAQSLTATDRLRQFTIEGVLLYSPLRWKVGRAHPFLSASAGYLRQLHEGDTLALSGQIYGFGGGATVPLVKSQSGRRMKSFGLRADLRAVIRTKAAAVDGKSHTSPAVGVSAFAAF
jgi:hypothetical protein